MQLIMTAVAAIAGMVFSLAIAILMEELIFGKVLPLVLVREPIAVKPSHATRRK